MGFVREINSTDPTFCSGPDFGHKLEEPILVDPANLPDSCPYAAIRMSRDDQQINANIKCCVGENPANTDLVACRFR